MSLATDPASPKDVILLVHGIRTQAEWAATIRHLLEEIPETKVVPVRYGFFDALRFLLPFKGLKTSKVKVVEQAIRDIKQRYPEVRLSILAHSFGCYIVGRILEEEPDIQLHRLVLCGSVLRRDFPWVAMGQDRVCSVLNDCGWRDIWPVLAESVTWGYGASGRHGFEGGTRVEDRFHDLSHSDFLTPDFARRYWLPFFRDGEVRRSNEGKRPTTPLWVSLLGVLKVRYLVVLILLLSPLLWARGLPWPFVDPEEEAVVDTEAATPEPLAPGAGEEIFANYPRLEWTPGEARDGNPSYEVRLSRSQDFAEDIIQSTGERPHISLNKVRALLGEGDGPIYWSVRARWGEEEPDAWSPAREFALYHDVLDRISRRGRVRIGVSRSQEDLFSCKGANDEWLGIDMDLVRRLLPFLDDALEASIANEFDVETFPWPQDDEAPDVTNLFEAVSERKVDFVISSVTSSKERERKYGVRFSEPYFFARQTIVRVPGAPETEADELIQALKGKRIGGQSGTTNWAYARHLETTAQPASGNETIGDLVFDLENGQLDAFFLDEPFAHMRNRVRARLEPPRPPLVLTAIDPAILSREGFPQPHSEDYGILMHPLEKELKRILDEAILELRDEGFIDFLASKARQESPCVGT